MRFPQLPIGARFVYQGRTYSKTSALLASAEDGSGQRIIPKYADLTPADGSCAEVAPQAQQVQVDMATLASAIDAYHAACRDLMQQVCQDPTQSEAALGALNAAHARMRCTLDEAAGN